MVELIGIILRQIVQMRGFVVEELKNMFKRAHKLSRSTSPNPEECIQLINDQLSRWKRFFLVVDAVDEYPEHSRMKFLWLVQNRIFDETRYCLNVLFTSRDETHLTAFFRERAKKLPIRAQKEDIMSYVRQRIAEAKLEEAPLAKNISREPYLEAEILDQISTKADEMLGTYAHH